jgi:hypothetical protein
LKPPPGTSGVETNVDLSEMLEGDKGPKTETVTEPAKEAETEQPRDESGRFAAKGEQKEPEEKAAPEAAQEAEKAPVETAPPAVQQTTDPRESAFLAKAQDETRKRQRLEQDLAAERQRLAEAQRRLQEYEAQKAPDFQTDPQGHLEYVRQQAAADAFNSKLNLSEQYARRTMGDEVVSEAQSAFMAAAQKDPLLRAELTRQDDPYGFVVKWHKREKFLAEVGDDPEAYKARLLAPPVAAPPPPPRSLASATGVRVSDKSVAAEPKPMSEIFGR